MKLKNQRNTNLELLRIIAMLLIIAHHFVVQGIRGIPFITTNPNTYVLYFYQCSVKALSKTCVINFN